MSLQPISSLSWSASLTLISARSSEELAATPIALWTVILIGVVLAFLLLLVAVGERRWRAAGLDLDGRNDERTR